MSKIKSLLSIILFAILGTIVVSCGDDDQEPEFTGVTLAGSWVTTDQNALKIKGTENVRKFQYEGVEHQIQCDKKYLKFEPKNKFTTEGKGKIVTHYPQGDIEYEYKSFTWTLDKDDPDNVITYVTFEDGTTIALQRTHINEEQFSYALKEELTSPIAFDRMLVSEINWSDFNGSGEITRENWEEKFGQYIKENNDKLKDLEEEGNEGGNAYDGNE